MCTLIAAVGQYPDCPLLVAANRDERLERPAAPPTVWPGEPRFLAPLDVQAKGTWLGLNAHGLFVGITNRFGAAVDPSRPSRGQLVVQALRARSAESLHAWLQRIGPADYNPFHLLYADRAHAFVTWFDGARVFHQPLAPGVHVVTERSLGGDDRSRTESIRRLWEALPPGEPSVEALRALLSWHRPEDPAGSVCVHVPQLGTRSSLVLKVRATLEASDWWWAEGAPCQAPHVDGGALLRTLSA